jgi:hypothetical protein
MCINGKTARERDSIKVGFQELLSEWKSRSFNGEILSGNMRLIHLGKTHPFNPFLNIQVDRKIINDHNDIWGDEVKKFIADLILISSTK